MEKIANELKTLIEQYRDALLAIPENRMVAKSAPGKWSKKEMMGHLVDSAQNNIRRFIVTQFEERPHIVYNQDNWVTAAGYQVYDTPELIQLWYLLNLQIARILENMSKETALRYCNTEKLHTLEWLATDYIKHLRHHLFEVLELEAVAYP